MRKKLTEEKEEIVESDNNKKSKYFTKRTIIILVILIITLFFAYKILYKTGKEVIELNWHITIPDNFKEEFHANEGPSFHGDGYRYSVYKGTSFLTELKEEKNEELEEEIKKIYEMLNVPKDKQIDFTNRYSWTKIEIDSDFVYCIYDIEFGRLYFYEYFQ